MNEKDKIREELKEVAPQLPRKAPATPFSVPEGYFESLTETIKNKAKRPTRAKVVLFYSPIWKQVAAAAIITGVLLGSVFVYRQTITPDINANPEAWVKKQINSVSDEKLNSFIDLTYQTDSLGETNVSVAKHQQEIASLTNDISDEEIQSLLSEISQHEIVNE